jgi:hypothetical protein
MSLMTEQQEGRLIAKSLVRSKAQHHLLVANQVQRTKFSESLSEMSQFLVTWVGLQTRVAINVT